MRVPSVIFVFSSVALILLVVWLFAERGRLIRSSTWRNPAPQERQIFSPQRELWVGEIE